MIRSASHTDSDSVDPGEIAALAELLRGRSVVVLTGAGCSTESGIPDYRGPEGRHRARAPLRYREFVDDGSARARYWAGSTVGWPRFSSARPNDAHRALAQLEAVGVVRGVITQNVDGLHQAAGSRRVLELHGSLESVRCLDCGNRVRRQRLQKRLLERNPGWEERVGKSTRAAAPDGDAELPARVAEAFRIPGCMICSGTLKPDVVFFGESVPSERVREAWELFAEADVLLVVGSSLAVYSGRRFVLGAEKEDVPVGVVNLGPCRADEVAAVRVDGRAGRVLPRTVRTLERR